MDAASEFRDDLTATDLYAAACACEDGATRGTILALASLWEGVPLSEVVRIWRIDPEILHAARMRLKHHGLSGLVSPAPHLGTRNPATEALRSPPDNPAETGVAKR